MSDKYRRVRDIQAAPPVGVSLRQAGSKPAKVMIAILSVLVLLLSGIGYSAVGRLGSEVASAGNLALGGGKGMKEAADGATDILLVGTDSRSDAQGNPLTDEELDRLRAGVDDGEENTDTIMVIRVPNDGTSATAVSIPRDTYVHDDELGNMKINGVFGANKLAAKEELVNEGEDDEDTIERDATDVGRQALVNAVTDLTGIEVDHFAEVGLFGFVMLTDAVDGVEVCLNEPVQDEFSGADFPAGTQTLDGAQALSFVRQRHGLPRGDLDRIVRQQAYMASLVSKILAAGTLTNPATLSNMSTAVERSVVLDEDWDLMSFATQLANLAGGNVVFSTIPVTSIDGTGDYGESIVTVDTAQVHDYMNELLSPPEEDAPAEEGAEEAPAESDGEEASSGSLLGVEIHVLNAGATAGLAGNVGDWLQDENFTVTEVRNALDGIYSFSQVVVADESDPRAQELADALGGLPITANAGLDAGTFIVVTASDYAGPLGEGQATPETSTEAPVGTPGSELEDGRLSPEIDAGGDGPQCVN